MIGWIIFTLWLLSGIIFVVSFMVYLIDKDELALLIAIISAVIFVVILSLTILGIGKFGVGQVSELIGNISK